MRSISFDQASLTGWAVMQDGLLIDYGIHDMSEEIHNPEVILQTKKWFIEMINKFQPEDNQEYIISVEDIQLQKNVETFKFLANLQGVLIDFLYEKYYDYVVIPPGTWRATCQIKGRDRKTQKKNAQIYVKNKYNIEATEDEADAICMGTHIHIKYKKLQKVKKMG